MLEATPERDRIRATVEETVTAVMAERDLDRSRFGPEAKLSETLGLRSMDLAQIVLTLEDELDSDPFQEIPITSIRTVGDLTAAYLSAAGLGDAPDAGAQDMAAEMAAAEARAGRRRR